MRKVRMDLKVTEEDLGVKDQRVSEALKAARVIKVLLEHLAGMDHWETQVKLEILDLMVPQEHLEHLVSLEVWDQQDYRDPQV